MEQLVYYWGAGSEILMSNFIKDKLEEGWYLQNIHVIGTDSNGNAIAAIISFFKSTEDGRVTIKLF